jgi:hypothetical protein
LLLLVEAGSDDVDAGEESAAIIILVLSTLRGVEAYLFLSAFLFSFFFSKEKMEGCYLQCNDDKCQ